MTPVDSFNSYDRYKYNNYRPRPRQRPSPRKPSLFGYFIVGIIGALIGGLLFAATYTGINTIPFEKEPAPMKNNDSSDLSTMPAEHPHTEVIGAVEAVAPAVVGISNSVSVVQGGTRVLLEQASGSGVVINSHGYIVTNQHVIDGADRIDVVFRDGTIAGASLVGEDVLTDLAVIKTDLGENVSPAGLSDSEYVRPGETAIAIGNPLGLIFQHTVTVGVVSATERQVPIPGSQYRYTYIQTDAAINEGNSGGPLINLAGEIIGINSAKIKDTGVEGIGFAIPSNTVERVVDDLVKHGKVRRPFFGIFIQDLAEVTGSSTDRGVYINEVNVDGPARDSDIRDGDVIIKIDDRDINFTAQLFDHLLNYQPGETVTIKLLRGNKEITRVVTLGEMPD